MTERGAVNTDGVLRCKATGKRCLTRKMAAELQHAARRRGDSLAVLRCDWCSWWHVGHNKPYVGSGGHRWRKGGSKDGRVRRRK